MEVDCNSRIIQLVQSRPVLYSKCDDFRARSHQWKEISDILKQDVSLVKSRWHLLRTKFLVEYSSELKGKATNFKYFNDMTFLVNHVNINAFEFHSKENEVVAQPEFIISKKDLDDVNDDDDSSNIFIELELDEEESKEFIQMHETMDISSENELDEYLPNDNVFQNRPEDAKTNSNVDMFHTVDIQEKEDSATVIINENSNDNAEQLSSNKPTPSEELVTSADTEPEVPSPIVKDVKIGSYNVNREKERCEDSIFGELVTATLRKMPIEKRKAVKREIMNILFT